jgi:cysteine synthase A
VDAFADSVLDLIGNTPLVEIKNMAGESDARIFAKLEMFNPSGSIKDRIVRRIIGDAEKTGKLKRGQTIIEATSGNTGIALSMIGALKGYKVKILMGESASLERKKIIRAFGAELTLVKDEYEAIRLAKKLAEENGYFLLNQFGSPLNASAHYDEVGKEILEQTGGKVDAFIAGIGTGGTIMGAGRRLKERNEKIRIIGIEPELESGIEGLLNFTDSGCKPAILDPCRIDEIVRVKDEDAFRTAKEIAEKEGLFVGISSGAVMSVALKKAKELGRGKNIVVIFADGGGRYLSTDVFG